MRNWNKDVLGWKFFKQIAFHPYYSGFKSIWVGLKQSKYGNPCFFNSYQIISCVAVNFRGKPFTQFRPKFHFNVPIQPIYWS